MTKTSAFLVLVAVILSALFGAMAWHLMRPPVVIPYDSKARQELVRRNIQEAAEAKAKLSEYAVKLASSDSLVDLLQARAKSIRVRTLPGRIDTLIRDTGTTCLPDSAVKLVMLSDSSCHVRSDSLEGANAELAFDNDALTDRVQQLEKRPATCNGWTAFGIGYAGGVASSIGVYTILKVGM